MTDLTETIKELQKKLKAHDPACLIIFALRNHIEKILDAAEKAERYEKALNGALGYLRNARIDLETGAPKRTAINTISGGVDRTPRGNTAKQLRAWQLHRQGVLDTKHRQGCSSRFASKNLAHLTKSQALTSLLSANQVFAELA